MSEAVAAPVAVRSKSRTRSLPSMLRLALRIAALGLLLAVQIVPIVWLLLSSFKEESEFSSQPFYALPQGLDVQNYVDAWERGNIGTYFTNSVLVVVPSLVLVVLLSITAAFAIELMRWRGRNAVLLLFIAGILIPIQLVLLPLFTIFFNAGLLDTKWSLILTYTAFSLPLAVFLMVGYYKAVPRELLEAAVVDGATIYQAFRRVALPVVANSIATVALVSFLFLWADLLLALTFVSSTDERTIQTGLLAFTDQYGRREWGPTFAAINLAAFPTILVFLLLNGRVMRGLTAGAVKG